MRIFINILGIILLCSCSSEPINDSSNQTNTQEAIVHNELYEEEVEDESVTEVVSSENTNRQPIQDMKFICFATTFGPDGCGWAAKEIFGMDTPDILMSPACSVIVSKVLSENITESDLMISTFTGALDSMSSDLFERKDLIGDIAGMYTMLLSLGTKFDVYNDCIRKKLNE